MQGKGRMKKRKDIAQSEFQETRKSVVKYFDVGPGCTGPAGSFGARCQIVISRNLITNSKMAKQAGIGLGLAVSSNGLRITEVL